jgi:hypothetical protein
MQPFPILPRLERVEQPPEASEEAPIILERRSHVRRLATTECIKLLAPLLLAFLCLGCDRGVEFSEYRSSDGKFRADFPGTPEVVKNPLPNNATVTVHTVAVKDGGYSVSFVDAPQPVADAEAAKKLLTVFMEGQFSERMQSKLDSQKDIKLQNQYAGIEYFGVSSNPKPNTQVRGRVYIVGNRLYHITVIGTDERVKAESSAMFLDSFRTEP